MSIRRCLCPHAKSISVSCCMMTRVLSGRERGARALEERLGARKAVPAAAIAHDLESGIAEESAAEPTTSSS